MPKSEDKRQKKLAKQKRRAKIRRAKAIHTGGSIQKASYPADTSLQAGRNRN